MPASSASVTLCGLPTELIMLILEHLNPMDIYSLISVESEYTPPITTNRLCNRNRLYHPFRDVCLIYNIRFGKLSLLHPLVLHDDAAIAGCLLSRASSFVHGFPDKTSILGFMQDDMWPILLTSAIRYRSTAVMKELLGFPAVHYFLKDQGLLQLALLDACNYYDVEVIGLFIESGADPEAVDEFGLTPLHILASKGNSDGAELLLTKYNVGCDSRDTFGCTPLFCAVQSRDFMTVKLLLANDADPDIQNDEAYTPLCKAAELGKADIVGLLLAHGADPTINRNGQHGPLGLAAKHGHCEVVRMLLNDGRVDPNAQGLLGYTPLMEAVNGCHSGTVKILLNCGSDPDRTNSEGETALHVALLRDSTFEMANLLIASPKVSPNVEDHLRLTPLKLALKCMTLISNRRAMEFIEELLATREIDINKGSLQSPSPLSFAISHCSIDAVRVLLNTGKAVITNRVLQAANGSRSREMYNMLKMEIGGSG